VSHYSGLGIAFLIDKRHSVQEVQLLSPKQASIRFLPNVIIGVILNATTGLFVQHARVDYLLTIASIFATLSPILLALTEPIWPYWYAEFWSMLLVPVSVDGRSFKTRTCFSQLTQMRSNVYHRTPYYCGCLPTEDSCPCGSNLQHCISIWIYRRHGCHGGCIIHILQAQG